MTLDYSKWPVITCPEDLPEDGSLDRMFAEWLVSQGVIYSDEVEEQIRLTHANRSARLKALEDLEAYKNNRGPKPELDYNPESKIFTQNGVSFMKRTVPLKRGRHRKD